MAPLFNTLVRYRGLYFSNYQAAPSFRDIAGYHLMLTIPREPPPFAEWLARKCEELDSRLAASGVAKKLPYGGNYSQTTQMVTETRPDFGRTWMDWTYELDLDTLVFSFMAEPMFRLDQIPPADECERYITQDHYGLWTCAPDLPERHSYRANWLQSPPAQATQSSSVNVRMNIPVDELLGTSTDRPDSERVCTRLYEVIVGQYFREYHHGFHQCCRPGAEDDSDDAAQLRKMLLHLLWPAVTPMIHKSESPYRIEDQRGRERRWLRSDVFLQVCVNLRSEAALHSVARSLVTGLHSKGANHNKIYGVLFSGNYLAIACFDKLQGLSQQIYQVSCSAILRFLPDRFGMYPSSPGIDALVRLGQAPCAALDSSILYRLHADIEPAAQVPSPLLSVHATPGRGSLLKLPHELLSFIVDHLDDGGLHNFATVSRQTNFAVCGTRRIRYPVIDRHHRLVRVRPLHFEPQILPNGDVLRSEEFHELVSAAFVTEDDKVLLLGFNPGIDIYLLQLNSMACWGSGTLAMPHVLGRQIRIPYIVLDKAAVADLESDATAENLLGRICRRGSRVWGQVQADEDDDL